MWDQQDVQLEPDDSSVPSEWPVIHYLVTSFIFYSAIATVAAVIDSSTFVHPSLNSSPSERENTQCSAASVRSLLQPLDHSCHKTWWMFRSSSFMWCRHPDRLRHSRPGLVLDGVSGDVDHQILCSLAHASATSVSVLLFWSVIPWFIWTFSLQHIE